MVFHSDDDVTRSNRRYCVRAEKQGSLLRWPMRILRVSDLESREFSATTTVGTVSTSSNLIVRPTTPIKRQEIIFVIHFQFIKTNRAQCV